MVIYRVENEKGEGPYHGSGANWDYDDEISYRATPGPFEDYGWLNELTRVGLAYDLVKKLHFGFPSRDAAVNWFGEKGLKLLAASGFPLKAFKVPHAIISGSGRQVMFNRSQAEEIKDGVEPKPPGRQEVYVPWLPLVSP